MLMMQSYRSFGPVYNRPRQKHRKKFLLAAILIVAAAALVFYWRGHYGNPVSTSKNEPAASGSPSTPAAFDKGRYSINDAASPWVVVNKGRVLPSDYVPANLVDPNVPLRLAASSPEMHLRADAASALETMFSDAKQQGLNFMLASGYRPYTEQVYLYSYYVSHDGQAAADASSARAGHSEHQTGLAADVEPAGRSCEVEQCFADTPEGKWLAANAHKYGFIIRYPKGQENQTGYEYEPWHVRYVGTDLAAQIYKAGASLEQYFGLAYYADYPASSFKLTVGAR